MSRALLYFFPLGAFFTANGERPSFLPFFFLSSLHYLLAFSDPHQEGPRFSLSFIPHYVMTQIGATGPPLPFLLSS